TVVDNFMPPLEAGASWTCTSAGRSTCRNNGTGNINEIVTVVGGGSLTFTVNGRFPSSLTGSFVNTATASNVGDTNNTNDESMTTQNLVSVADIRVTKSFDIGGSTPTPGTEGSYIIVVTNAGPSDASGIEVIDNFVPPFEAGASWTCAD